MRLGLVWTLKTGAGLGPTEPAPPYPASESGPGVLSSVLTSTMIEDNDCRVTGNIYNVCQYIIMFPCVEHKET